MKTSRNNPAWTRNGSWRWLVVLTVLIGLALTLGVALIVRDWEQQSWENDFQQYAQAYRNRLITLLGQRIEQMEYLSILHELSEETDITSKFVQAVLQRHPEINYIGWVSRVLHTERNDFIAAQKEAGYGNYEILERNAANQFMTAPDREVYYPLTRIRPLARFSHLLGRTPTSSYCPDSNYIEQAIAQRRAVVSIPQKSEVGQDGYAIKIYLPLFEFIDHSTEQLSGVVVMVFDLSRMMSRLALFGQTQAQPLNVMLFDTTNASQALMIYAEPDAATSQPLLTAENLEQQPQLLPQLHPEQQKGELYTIPFANREWLLQVTPSENLKANRSRWAFLLTLTAGLVITALIYAFLDSFARHTREVEKKVEERTVQLSKANALLADQISAKEVALEKLSKSEARFRLLTENSTDIIARHDLEGKCLYASTAAKQLLGYEPEAMLGRSIYPLLSKSDIEPMRRLHSALLDSDEVTTIVFRAKHKDRHLVWLETSCLTIYDQVSGEAAEIQSISRDISARKAAEEALRENEERFRGAFEDAAIGMALVDANGKFQRVNHQLCQISGYPREELAALDLQSITHPADMVKNQEKMTMVFEGQARTFHLETRLMHKKGYIVWAMISATLVAGQNARTPYFVMQVQDINDRKRAEKALEALNNKHKLILNAAAEGIVGFDTEGRVSFANMAAEKLLGYEEGELQGKPFHSWVLHARADSSVYQFKDSPLFQALHLGKTNSVLAELFWRKDQTNFNATYICAPIQTNETISGAVIVFSDTKDNQSSAVGRNFMPRGAAAHKKPWTEKKQQDS